MSYTVFPNYLQNIIKIFYDWILIIWVFFYKYTHFLHTFNFVDEKLNMLHKVFIIILNEHC